MNLELMLRFTFSLFAFCENILIIFLYTPHETAVICLKTLRFKKSFLFFCFRGIVGSAKTTIASSQFKYLLSEVFTAITNPLESVPFEIKNFTS